MAPQHRPGAMPASGSAGGSRGTLPVPRAIAIKDNGDIMQQPSIESPVFALPGMDALLSVRRATKELGGEYQERYA